MKKAILSLICLLFGVSSVFAEASTCKILYLIPFDSENYVSPAVKESEEMDVVRSYQMMGFWNGAQMAIEEMSAEENIHFDVVVRDISNDETKLRRILEDVELMRGVDIIIGPFFGRLFTIAAEYAKQYRIPIVNPFTTRRDVLEDNDYVFKLIPAVESRPLMIAFMAQQSGAFPVIIYGDSTSDSREMATYLRYFKENKVPYEITSNPSTVVKRLERGKPCYVVTFYDNPAQNLLISRDLLYSEKIENLTFVVPETWLESKTYDIEYYTKLNLHFFSNYYVDFGAEKTKTFIYDYTQKYGVPPSLEHFAFQGYDITRYFVELSLAHMDFDRVKVTPLAFPFSFEKSPNGGYENVDVQFLEIKDHEIVPSGF